MDLTAGAILAHQKKLGDRVVILHMTLGEAGNPNMPHAQYAEQKRREALESGKALGAEVIIGPYADALLPNDEEARKYVVDVIRQVKPTYVITHWKKQFPQRPSEYAHAIVVDAVLMAELEAVKTGPPPYRGIKGVFYTDNWEDSEDFKPYIYVDVSDVFDQWKQTIHAYQMVRGGVSPPLFRLLHRSSERRRRLDWKEVRGSAWMLRNRQSGVLSIHCANRGAAALRLKYCHLSILAGTATSKKPTSISS